MKKIILIGLISALAGCATPQSVTKKFYGQENAVHRACLAPIATLTGEQRFTVDPVTHKAPVSAYLDCYSSGVLTVAHTMQYSHLDVVYAYLGYQERLVEALNEGRINPATARTAFTQSVKSFEQSLALGDVQLAAQADQARREFADKLAVLGTVIAEADRQRAAAAAASRPVMCTSTGVYVQNTVICQ